MSNMEWIDSVKLSCLEPCCCRFNVMRNWQLIAVAVLKAPHIVETCNHFLEIWNKDAENLKIIMSRIMFTTSSCSSPLITFITIMCNLHSKKEYILHQLMPVWIEQLKQ